MRVVLTFDRHAEAVDREIARNARKRPAREKLERGFRRFVGITLVLARLDLIEKRLHARIVLVGGQAETFERRRQRRPPALLRHQDAALVADAFRRNVLVGFRLLDQRRSMDAGFGRKGAFADVGRVPVRRFVQHFIENAAGVRQRPQPVGRNAGCRRHRRIRSSKAASG